MAVRNLGQVQAIWIGTTAPINTTMIWYDTNTGVYLHKYFDIMTSTWVTFTLNSATLPLFRSGNSIALGYNTVQFELVGDLLSIKDDILASVTPPFPISDITGLQDALDSKVDKVAGKSLISDAEILRLSSVTNYNHPATHPPSIIVQDEENRFVTEVQIDTWDSKQDSIGYVPYDAENPAGYITEADLTALKLLTGYVITLPSDSEVQARIDAATEGIDYPTGWVLSASPLNSHDLLIEHGLNKSMASVVISANMGEGGIRRLMNNAAYSGLVEYSSGSLTIEALATVAADIVITIIFV